jgi:aminoglycoside phosphotransferase (APT) family kinase protein
LGQDTEADLDSLVELVRKAGLCSEDENPTVETFSGGVSSLVILVRGSRGAWIVKQVLPQLRVKDEWFADTTRIFAECECLKLVRDLIGGRPAPEVLFEDKDHFACVLEYAGDGSRTWKQDLLSGLVDRKVTRRVAAILAELHSRTRGNERVKKELGGDSNFRQLRLDPYLATTALRHPEIKPELDEIASFLAKEKLCLVHGDFSPKNILLLPDGRVWIIDCEVAHLGNPVFDIAFCTNHLILKSVHLDSPAHLDEAQALWSMYWLGNPFADLEGEAVRTLSALMLARVDGKSTVEYLNDQERERVRNVSRVLIKEREETFTTLIRRVREGAGGGGAL